VWGVLIDTSQPTDALNRADLEAPYELHPQVSLRPEPFGALAYHYGNRRLVFLRKHEIVNVVEALAAQPSLRSALVASDVDESRWSSFLSALGDLARSEIIRVRAS
jgi:putative mycofactocin binding protein MftB